MHNRLSIYASILWCAMSMFASAEDVAGLVRPILDASQEPFVVFARRTVEISLPLFPSPAQAEANPQLNEVSMLLWKRLSAIDLHITVEKRKEKMEVIKAMCSLHKWLMQREGYTNLVLAAYIQEIVSKALLAAVAEGSATIDDALNVGVLLEQAPSIETIISIVEHMAPKSKVLLDYREATRTARPGTTSICVAALSFLQERHETPAADPDSLLTRERPASLLCYAVNISGGQLLSTKLLIDYARKGGNLRLPREDLVKDIRQRAPEIADTIVPGYGVIQVDSLAIVMERAREWNAKQ